MISAGDDLGLIVIEREVRGGPKDGDGAGRQGLARNAQENRAVQERIISSINESASCGESHVRWRTGGSAEIDWPRVSKTVGCRDIRNGLESRVLGATFESHGGRWRCRTDKPDFCDGELVRSHKLHLDLAAMGDGPLARRTQLGEQLVHGRVGLVVRENGAVVEDGHRQNDGDDANGNEDFH